MVFVTTDVMDVTDPHQQIVSNAYRMDIKKMIFEYVIVDSQGQSVQITLVIDMTNVTDALDQRHIIAKDASKTL